jgi:hypothetical protein
VAVVVIAVAVVATVAIRAGTKQPQISVTG